MYALQLMVNVLIKILCVTTMRIINNINICTCNENLSQIQIVWKMTAKLIMAIDHCITKWISK